MVLIICSEEGEYALADVSAFGILGNSAKTGRKTESKTLKTIH